MSQMMIPMFLMMGVSELDLERMRFTKRKKKNKLRVLQREATIHDLAGVMFSSDIYQDQFPNLMKLFEICLVIPMVTVHCERSFSAMKRIKTRLRNRLGLDVLNALLRVALNGPRFEEFDFKGAFSLWKNSANRRLFTT